MNLFIGLLVGFVVGGCAMSLFNNDAYMQKLQDAVDELLEVANLRGDNELPHPADDTMLWTARMQDAWDTLANLRPEYT